MESAEFFVQSKSSLHDFVSYLITFARYNNSVTEIFYEQGWEHPLLLILEDTWKIQIFWFHIALSHEKYESPSNAVQERAHTFLFFFIVAVIIFTECVECLFSRSHMSHWYTIVILLVHHCVRIFISVITKSVLTLTTRTQVSAILHFIYFEKWYVQFYTKLTIYYKTFDNDNNNNNIDR